MNILCIPSKKEYKITNLNHFDDQKAVQKPA